MDDDKKKFNPLGGDWLMGKAGKSQEDKEESKEESTEEVVEETKESSDKSSEDTEDK